MSQDVFLIRKLIAFIVDSAQSVTSLGMKVMQLILLLRGVADARPEFTAIKRVSSPSPTNTGVGLDPWQASLSMEDRNRTAALIPEKISIDLQLIHSSEEFQTMPLKPKGRELLGRVFGLNRRVLNCRLLKTEAFLRQRLKCLHR